MTEDRILDVSVDEEVQVWSSRAHTHTHSLICFVALYVSLFLCSDACDLTLDPNTANTRLILSDENRKITCVKDHQPYPDYPERFDECHQVLCVESLTGRCYWEAEWSGRVKISVSYKGISRKGGTDDCWFGSSDKSWSLYCSDNRFTVRHNNNRTVIPAIRSSSNRAGVYVDVSAGTLSFYSVSDTHIVTHLHTFNTTFTEPLCAGFRVYPDSSLSLCD
ncbi:stonustoxin subunit beta-like [Sinocyclocheilus rhinocerous]|uniref:stonustoxin subunit beta-like n=1 Tax=Sinocyclocheilus rhinocerous TaxID=307959 RepID=UPI0007B792E7|nr:PREDICTED: stonustoxin subunit beta-like [Sinocyclocheilus rhinocerous]